MKKLIICLFGVLPVLGFSQSSLSFEFQAYPTGLIPGLRYEKTINDQSSVHFRLGYQWIRHRDLGKHDDERGYGFGFTLGYKHKISAISPSLSLAIRNDIWWNSIDWEDDMYVPHRTGQTDITVIQPTMELSYALGSENLSFSPSLAFGYEWNVKIEGENTGEGAIILIGFILGKKF